MLEHDVLDVLAPSSTPALLPDDGQAAFADIAVNDTQNDDELKVSYLLTLPPEILSQILLEAGPRGTAFACSTCKHLYEFLSSPTLHKALYYSLFDSPSPHSPSPYPYWETVKSRTSAALSLKKHTNLVADDEGWERVLTIVGSIAAERTPGGGGGGGEESKNQEWIDQHFPEEVGYLMRMPLVKTRLRSSAKARLIPPGVSRLHTLHTPTSSSHRTPRSRTYYREIVYNKSNFSFSSKWGPFLDRTARVDWQKLEALAVVMRGNLGEVEDDWGPERPGGWASTRGRREPEVGVKDWAGVEDGAFLGTYSFLDYRSFEHFNYHRSAAYTPTLDDETEAVGECMKLTLKLVPEETRYGSEVNSFPSPTASDADDESEEDSDDDDEDDDDDGSAFGSGDEEDDVREPPATRRKLSPPSESSSRGGGGGGEKAKEIASTHPTLVFSGTSKPLHFTGQFATTSQTMPARSIRGTVSMTPDGEVHWAYTISYDGGPKWLMHGVQIGGVKSPYGIVGTWSTADHDDAGPNGPFWYWPDQSA